jgi:hypothetical protein
MNPETLAVLRQCEQELASNQNALPYIDVGGEELLERIRNAISDETGETKRETVIVKTEIVNELLQEAHAFLPTPEQGDMMPLIRLVRLVCRSHKALEEQNSLLREAVMSGIVPRTVEQPQEEVALPANDVLSLFFSSRASRDIKVPTVDHILNALISRLSPPAQAFFQARQRFAHAYSQQKGWGPLETLTTEQMQEITEQPGWTQVDSLNFDAK